MANTLTTAAQLLQIADQNLDPAFVNDLLDDAPFLKQMSAVLANASNGTQHKYLKDTTATSGGFRAINDGTDYTASTQTLVTNTLQVLTANVRVDQQIAKAYPGGVEAFMDFEGARSLRKAMAVAEAQFFYGVSNDSAGFVGLKANTYIDALADGQVYGAGGSSALTSVYLMRQGTDGVELILGRDGNIEVGETMEQLILGANSKEMPVYFRVQEALMGFKMGGAYSVARIANLAASTYTLTDAMIYEAIALFPSSRQPTVIAMNRRSLKQLRASRTATSPTGAPAPIPTEVEGIPIVVTDGISNAETAVA